MVLDPSKKVELARQDYLDMGLPKSFRNLRYDQFSGLESYSQLATYMRHLDENIQRGYGCFIYGPPHTGKSTKAAYIATVACQYGFHVRWVTAVALYDAIANREYDPGGEQLWATKYAETGLLVVDDLTNEWECYKRTGHLVQFLTDRIDAGKPTIITCPIENMKTFEERKIYAPQLISKIKNKFYGYFCNDFFPPMAEVPS